MTETVYQNSSDVATIELVIPAGKFLWDVYPTDAPPVVVLQAGMGDGKSVLCDRLALSVARVCTIVPEKALARGLAASRSSELYDACRPDAPRVVSTVHSLRKLDHGRDRWDLVIVEELPLIGDVLFSECAESSGGGRAIFSCLLRHFAGARRIIMQSADITGREAEAWRRALALVGIEHVAVIVARREVSL